MYLSDLESNLITAKRNGYEEGRAEGEAVGRAEGEAVGRAEGKQEILRSLLESGIPIEMIQAAIGLSLEEIEELRSDTT